MRYEAFGGWRENWVGRLLRFATKLWHCRCRYLYDKPCALCWLIDRIPYSTPTFRASEYEPFCIRCGAHPIKIARDFCEECSAFYGEAPE